MENDNRWVEDRLAELAPPDGWSADALRGRERLRRGQAAHAARVRSARWACAVVAVALCALAFPATRVLAKRCVDVCVAETSLVMRGAAPVRLAGDRTPAPDFVLADANGRRVTLSALRGQVVLLNFWATWCPPCTEEIPWFVQLEARRRTEGFAVLGISMDDDGWKAITPWASERNINYTIASGNKQVAQSYGGVHSLPSSFLIDKEGRIAVTYIGIVNREKCEADVAALLAENQGGVL